MRKQEKFVYSSLWKGEQTEKFDERVSGPLRELTRVHGNEILSRKEHCPEKTLKENFGQVRKAVHALPYACVKFFRNYKCLLLLANSYEKGKEQMCETCLPRVLDAHDYKGRPLLGWYAQPE